MQFLDPLSCCEMAAYWQTTRPELLQSCKAPVMCDDPICCSKGASKWITLQVGLALSRGGFVGKMIHHEHVASLQTHVIQTLKAIKLEAVI